MSGEIGLADCFDKLPVNASVKLLLQKKGYHNQQNTKL